MNDIQHNPVEPECKAQTILHTKRNIAMIFLAIMVLAVVTMAIYVTRLANASYDDHKDPKTSSLFHYEVQGL